MGVVQPLPSSPEPDESTVHPAPSANQPAASVHLMETATCALCGTKLATDALRYRMVTPQSTDSVITVCRTCRKASLGEGYRPA